MKATNHGPADNRGTIGRRLPGAASGLRATVLAVLAAAGMLLSVAAAQGNAISSEATFPNGIKGQVSMAPAKGFVGSQAVLSGTGFDPGASLDVVWVGYNGQWKLEMKNGEYTGNFLGREFETRNVPISTVTVGSDGSFSLPFTVPEGFGGTHDVYVMENGANVNKAGYDVEMKTTMSPMSGPVGTNITITLTGVDDISNIAGWYAVTYDNGITGFVTAVTTHGTAKVVIPAAGRVGKHLIELFNAPFDAPYLALSTSPYKMLPQPQFMFTVTDGPPVLPAPIAQQAPKPTPAVITAAAGPKLWVDPMAAVPGTPAQIHGTGLPARAFSLPFTMPDQHGGGHQLLAKVGDKVIATTDFTIDSEGLPLEPARGPVGTHFTLHLKGIGWTQTTNIFAVVIDNVYLGYGCGFSTDGDVQIPITASWAPGWHFIDIYPSFYRNKDYEGADQQPFLYRQAILTWQDHPHQIHFRYAFYVTGEGTVASTEPVN
ncbi:MAG: hypothetical protein P8Z81_14790 [Deinococcales bacterium]